MIKPNISDAQLWDIDRYLLDDESLDRAAFEASMLADERLAWAVAEELERLQLLSQPAVTHAARLPGAEPDAGRSHGRRRLRLVALLAVSAAAVFALLNWREPAAPPLPVVAVGEEQLQAVVQQWLALEVPAGSVETGERDAYSVLTLLEPLEAAAGGEAAVESDWMMDVAALYFRDADI